jgi:hypothetical protein
MISDVLSDAVGHIEDYMREGAPYRDIVVEISVVTTLMEAMRIYLESGSAQEPPAVEARRTSLLAAIRQVDISGVRAAMAAGVNENGKPTD